MESPLTANTFVEQVLVHCKTLGQVISPNHYKELICQCYSYFHFEEGETDVRKMTLQVNFRIEIETWTVLMVEDNILFTSFLYLHGDSYVVVNGTLVFRKICFGILKILSIFSPSAVSLQQSSILSYGQYIITP